MDAPRNPDDAGRTYEALVDSQALHTTIIGTLDATPVDEHALRLCVWRYVGTERHAGTAAGRVIVALTELVEAAPRLTPDVRQVLLRKVILWCVEAFFGHLGGDVVGRETAAFGDPAHVAVR